MKAGLVLGVVNMLLLCLPFCEGGKSPATKYYFARNPGFFKKDSEDDYLGEETLEGVESLVGEPLGEFVFWTRKKMSVYITGDPNESDMVVLFYDEGGFSRNVLKIADSVAKTGGLLVVVPDFEFRKYGRGGGSVGRRNEFYVRRGRQSKLGSQSKKRDSFRMRQADQYDTESQEVVVSANDVAGKTSQIMQYVFESVLAKMKIQPDVESGEGNVASSLTSSTPGTAGSTSTLATVLYATSSSPAVKPSSATTRIPATTYIPRTADGIIHFEIPILSHEIVKAEASKSNRSLTLELEKSFNQTSEDESELKKFTGSTSSASEPEIQRTTSIVGGTTLAPMKIATSSTHTLETSIAPTTTLSMKQKVTASDTSVSSLAPPAKATTSPLLTKTQVPGPPNPKLVSSSATTAAPTSATVKSCCGATHSEVPTVSMKSMVKSTSSSTRKKADFTTGATGATPSSQPAGRSSSFAGPKDMNSYLNKSACVMGIGAGGSEVLRIATNLAISRYKCGVHIDTFGLAKYEADLVQFPLLTMWSHGDSSDYERFGKALARRFAPRLQNTRRFPRMQPGFAGSSGNFSDPAVQRGVKEFVLLSTAYIRLFLKKPVLHSLVS